MRIAAGFDNFGPYHLARLNALGRQSKLLGIELFGQSATYAWDTTKKAPVDFERKTLFSTGKNRPSRSDFKMAIEDVLADFKPDLVLVPGWSGVMSLAMLAWCHDNKVPSVVMSESNAFDHPRQTLREWVKAMLVRQHGAGLVGGTTHKEYLVKLGIPANRIEIGYNAVDNAHFSGSNELINRPYNRRYVLASARFIGIKNLDGLLRAFSRFIKSGGPTELDLVLLGDGEERARLEKLSDTLGLSDRVVMPGFVQYPELPIWYHHAEGFIHVSAVEPWGLVVNEAMAASLPVIVSKACGAAELVSQGENGWVVAGHDEEAIAVHLLALASDPALRERMGKRSAELIAAYGPEQFAVGALTAARHAIKAGLPRRNLAQQIVLAAALARVS
jgi:glycosyltransferase involved in cell wall biosynthesis